MSEGIDYFNRGHWLTPLQEKLSLGARRRMFERWRTYARNFEAKNELVTLLDIGATPDCERLDSNCMIPWFTAEKMQVNLYSPEPIENLAAVFPRAAILTALPAPTPMFTWVSSSAVLEHVGSRDSQIEFIRSCADRGNGIFLTTPNRYHWLEFHTKLPFIHWFPKAIHRRILRAFGLRFWADPNHLNLVSRPELQEMAKTALGDAFTVEVQTVWALGMPSNLVLLAKRTADAERP